MKKITLANNKGTAPVDDEDFVILSVYSWSTHKGGYAKAKVKGKSVLLFEKMEKLCSVRVLIQN